MGNSIEAQEKEERLMGLTTMSRFHVVAMTFLLFPIAVLAEDFSIFYGQSAPAQRVNVASSGGYFPVLIQLDNKDLVAAVRGGDTHIGVKGRLDWVRSKDGGMTWTSKTLVDSPMDDRNPAVGQLADGSVVVSYIVDKSYGPDGKRLQTLTRDGLYTVRSFDRGNTWQPPIKSPIAKDLGGSPYGKIVQLSDGTVLLNVYYERGPRYEHETSLVYRSKDSGQTWNDPTVIADNYNETGLLVLPGERILAVLRSHFGAFLATSFSNDKGRTWSDPRKITDNMEHPGDVILLKDGRLLIVYGERNRPFGTRAMLSKNLGQEWDPRIIILAADAHNSDCGYPSSVEIEPGRIVTMYYGVDQSRDETGRLMPTLPGAYGRAILWRIPE
jgi:hypothetical protein